MLTDNKSQNVFRFLSKIIAYENLCWKINSFHHKGYPMVKFNGSVWRAHRLSWSIFNSSPIPSGLVIRHKCDNPGCVNPDHLEIGTQKDNNIDKILRGRCPHKNKTHCKHGHEFTLENTRYCQYGRRVCKKCALLRSQKHRKGVLNAKA